MRALAGALGAYLGVITFILRLKSGAVEANSKQESKTVALEGHPGAVEYQPGILEAPTEL
jgi:hypothetical protein